MKAKETSRHTCEGQNCRRATSPFFKRLLVAVDASEQSEFAIEVAARLARQLNADVILINVFSAAQFSNPEIGFIEPDIRGFCIEAANALLTGIKAKMSTQSEIETVLREGDPATEILNAALIYDADLIIMGTHARGRVAQVVLGSVARAVTQKAHCPVLTVAHAPLDHRTTQVLNVKEKAAVTIA